MYDLGILTTSKTEDMLPSIPHSVHVNNTHTYLCQLAFLTVNVLSVCEFGRNDRVILSISFNFACLPISLATHISINMRPVSLGEASLKYQHYISDCNLRFMTYCVN